MPDNDLSGGLYSVIVLLLKSSAKKINTIKFNLVPDKEAYLPSFLFMSLTVPLVNGVVVRECSSGSL